RVLRCKTQPPVHKLAIWSREIDEPCFASTQNTATRRRLGALYPRCRGFWLVGAIRRAWECLKSVIFTRIEVLGGCDGSGKSMVFVPDGRAGHGLNGTRRSGHVARFFRLVEKKRGERRTSSNWVGQLGEATFCGCLFLLGTLLLSVIVASQIAE